MTILPHHHPRGLFYIVLIIIAEYFSYYGLRALLVLYLTQALLLADHHAYALYGAYTSMVYVTPIVGGMLTDRFLGARWSTILGATLMTCGYTVLTVSGSQAAVFYLGLAFIVCGYGLFKTSASCLLGELYHTNDPRRDSGFTWMYVGGNIGGVISPIICAYVAQHWGWHYGFMIAGIGMAIGLLLFLCGRHHFTGCAVAHWNTLSEYGLLSWRTTPALLIGAAVSIIPITLVLLHLLAGWLLLIVVILAAPLLAKLYYQSDKTGRQALRVISLFMLFGLIFWAFDQQGGSSISLFIQRNVDRYIAGYIIPAASFQSINPLAVLIGGSLVAYLWRLLSRHHIRSHALLKLMCSIIMLTVGFYIIRLGAQIAVLNCGHVSFIWVVVGLSIIGVAELFVDPVALAEITRLNPPQSVGLLVGIYWLSSGSLANYLAAQIAMLTSVKTSAGHVVNRISAAKHYFAAFNEITWWCVGACVILASIVFLVLYRRSLNHRAM